MSSLKLLRQNRVQFHETIKCNEL